MSAKNPMQKVLEAMEQIADALPQDPRVAVSALSFTLVEVAAQAGISDAEALAAINQAMTTRAAAVRQVTS